MKIEQWNLEDILIYRGFLFHISIGKSINFSKIGPKNTFLQEWFCLTYWEHKISSSNPFGLKMRLKHLKTFKWKVGELSAIVWTSKTDIVKWTPNVSPPSFCFNEASFEMLTFCYRACVEQILKSIFVLDCLSFKILLFVQWILTGQFES